MSNNPSALPCKTSPREWRRRVAHAAGGFVGNLDALAAASEDDGMVAHDIAAAQRGETDSAVFAFPGVTFPGIHGAVCQPRTLRPAITSPSLGRCRTARRPSCGDAFRGISTSYPASSDFAASSNSLNTVLTPSE